MKSISFSISFFLILSCLFVGLDASTSSATTSTHSLRSSPVNVQYGTETTGTIVIGYNPTNKNAGYTIKTTSGILTRSFNELTETKRVLSKSTQKDIEADLSLTKLNGKDSTIATVDDIIEVLKKAGLTISS